MSEFVPLPKRLPCTIIDSALFPRFKLAHNKIALVVKTTEMEVSEHTKERKQLVAVGTGIWRGEDHSARGGIYVFKSSKSSRSPDGQRRTANSSW
jgi:hypothetical protein